MKLGAIHHFGLVVQNIESSILWYQNVLDFRIERQFGFPEAGLKIAHVVHDGGGVSNCSSKTVPPQTLTSV